MEQLDEFTENLFGLVKITRIFITNNSGLFSCSDLHRDLDLTPLIDVNREIIEFLTHMVPDHKIIGYDYFNNIDAPDEWFSIDIRSLEHDSESIHNLLVLSASGKEGLFIPQIGHIRQLQPRFNRRISINRPSYYPIYYTKKIGLCRI